MDHNAYCPDHINGTGGNSAIIAFPGSFHAEAEAFGAQAGGMHVWTEPFMLNKLPMLDETPPITSILAEIEKIPPGKTALLKANCPYSILAALVEPSLFYRWLLHNKNEMHNALCTITRGLASYIDKAMKKGVQILSLADPYANMQTLGKKRYAEFPARYLVSLLATLVNNKDSAGGLIHLCPYTSIALEELHLVTADKVKEDGNNYIEMIDCYIKGHL
jgi:uroporphyrinogen-III decarboxylase